MLGFNSNLLLLKFDLISDITKFICFLSFILILKRLISPCLLYVILSEFSLKIIKYFFCENIDNEQKSNIAVKRFLIIKIYGQACEAVAFQLLYVDNILF